ncbi:hypothetical protein [uncultured Actinobacillus sp.]|uniref:COG4648 family protein n=1 Tax=uncultured Actinobacillus sp. TaxID=417616 RepID=UPI0025FE4B2A|nr:hypothetical protein [uncultured Actinobacillus sp.]
MKALINALLTLLSVAYPVGILLDWHWQWLGVFPFGLALLWALKAWQAVRFHRYFAIFMTALLLLSGISRTAFNVMYWYPVLINGMLLALFGSSLWAKQSAVERLARLQDPNLPPEAVAYTRKVTQLWCGVFILNIVISSTLVWLNEIDLWALYTGVIAYVIIGVVMAGEWLVRPKHK